MRRTLLVPILLFASTAFAASDPFCSPGNPGASALRSGNGITAPKLIYGSEVSFSDQARKKQIDAATYLSLVVDETGNPRCVQITQPAGYGLDEEALKSVRSYRFEPGRRGDLPVVTKLRTSIKFTHGLAAFSDSSVIDEEAFCAKRGPARHLPLAGGEITSPMVVHSAPMDLTPEAQKANAAGIAHLSLVVDIQGGPHCAEVIGRLPYKLEAKAIASARSHRFKSAEAADGEPIAVRTILDISYGSTTTHP